MIGWGDVYKVVAAMAPLYFALGLGYSSLRWWKLFTPDQCDAVNRLVAYPPCPSSASTSPRASTPSRSATASSPPTPWPSSPSRSPSPPGQLPRPRAAAAPAPRAPTAARARTGPCRGASPASRWPRSTTRSPWACRCWTPCTASERATSSCRSPWCRTSSTSRSCGRREAGRRIGGGSRRRGRKRRRRRDGGAVVLAVGSSGVDQGDADPNVYAGVLGVAWACVTNRWHIETPSIIEGSVLIMSRTGVGLSMFSMGQFMALQEKVIACGTGPTVLGMVLRFVTGPAVTATGAVALGLRGDILRLAIIQAALPQSITTFVFAREYGLHADVLSTAVIFGTLASLPLLIVYYIVLGLIRC